MMLCNSLKWVSVRQGRFEGVVIKNRSAQLMLKQFDLQHRNFLTSNVIGRFGV